MFLRKNEYMKDIYELRINDEMNEIILALFLKAIEFFKPEKIFKATTGLEPMNSAIPVRCYTNWAMKPWYVGSRSIVVSNILQME